MSGIILHHYRLSPFSRKIRSTLGYTQLPWSSALTKEMPPRPILEHLAGGYRKVPIAQNGADIFCDSRIICAEIAALANKPELNVANGSQEIQAFVSEADSKVFFACIGQAMSWKLNKRMMKDMSILGLFKFIKDRVDIGRNISIPILKPAQAKAFLKVYFERLEQNLNQDFLFGNAPTIADFSAYHSLWFIRDIAEKPLLKPYPKINQWMNRIEAFGEGVVTEIDPETTLNIAAEATPREIAEALKQSQEIGKNVAIAPADYAQTATRGTLVGESDQRWIIARTDSVVGDVHVHFPKTDFSLSIC